MLARIMIRQKILRKTATLADNFKMLYFIIRTAKKEMHFLRKYTIKPELIYMKILTNQECFICLT